MKKLKDFFNLFKIFIVMNRNEKKYFELDEDLYLIGRIEEDKDEDDNYYLSKNENS